MGLPRRGIWDEAMPRHRKSAKRKNTEELVANADAGAVLSAERIPKPVLIPKIEMQLPEPEPYAKALPRQEADTAYAKRRDKPLVPKVPPLDWFSELEKHCPLPLKR
jgi:hypothetical protein